MVALEENSTALREDIAKTYEAQAETENTIFSDIENLQIQMGKVTEGQADSTSTVDERLKETNTMIQQLESTVQSAVTRETFNKFAESLKPMQATIQNMLDVQTRQVAPQPPAAPQIQTPQMMNGMPPSHVNSPHINGVPRPRSATPQEVTKMQVDQIQEQINGVVLVVQHLKQRCDNLTTDEIVRLMAEQISGIFPEAKNFSNTVKAVSDRIRSCDLRLGETERRTRNVEGTVSKLQQTDLPEVYNRLNIQGKAIADNGKATGGVQGEVVILKSQTSTPGKSTGGPVKPEDITSLRKDLDDTAKVAKAAEDLSKSHASRFSKLMPEKRLTVLEDSAKDHDGRLKSVEESQAATAEEVAGMQGELADAKASISSLDSVFRPK